MYWLAYKGAVLMSDNMMPWLICIISKLLWNMLLLTMNTTLSRQGMQCQYFLSNYQTEVKQSNQRAGEILFIWFALCGAGNIAHLDLERSKSLNSVPVRCPLLSTSYTGPLLKKIQPESSWVHGRSNSSLNQVGLIPPSISSH